MIQTLTPPKKRQIVPRAEDWQEISRRLDEMLGIDNSPGQKPFYERATDEEWIAALELWAKSHDPNGPVLLDDSREAIYED